MAVSIHWTYGNRNVIRGNKGLCRTIFCIGKCVTKIPKYSNTNPVSNSIFAGQKHTSHNIIMYDMG